MPMRALSKATMNAMRPVVAFLFLSLLLPFVASAALTQSVSSQAPPVVASKCPKGYSTGDPSGARVFSQSQISTLQTYLQQVVYCANACFDVRTAISISSADSSLYVRTTATNKCADKAKLAQDQTPPRGCSKGQTQPTVIADVPSIVRFGVTIEPPHTIGPKSRCDTSISGIVNSMFGRIGSSDLNGFRSDIASLQNLPSVTPPTINVGSVNGSEQIAKELAAGTGISVSEAQAIVAKDPLAAINAINAMSTGTAEEGKQAASALGLNPDLVNQSALQAAVREGGSLTDPNEGKTRQAEFGLNNTFNLNPESSSRAVLPPDFDQMRLCQARGGCGDFIQHVGKTFYTSQLSWFNDYMCSTGPCDNATPGLAHRSWPIGSVVEVCNQQNGICTNAVVMDRGPNERLNARTIDANPALRSVLQMNGGLVPATYTLLSTPGSSVTAQAPGLVRPSAEVVANSYVNPSPFDTFASVERGTLYGPSYGSPFANVSPVPIGYPTTIGAPTGGYTAPSQTFPQAQTQQQTFQQTPTAQQPVSQTLSQTPQGQNTTSQPSVAQQLIDAIRGKPATQNVSGTNNPPIATNIVQPKTISRGNSITASWSSIGMKSDSPCQVFVNKVFLLG